MPVANVEGSVERVLKEILSLPYQNLRVYAIVDGRSKDNTEQIIRTYEQKTDKVKCIFYKKSRGVATCYREGIRQALADGAEQIIQMDGCGSHAPSELSKLIQKLDEGYECVWGSRFMKRSSSYDAPWYRKVFSKVGTIFSNIVLGTRLKDMTSGYDAFQREVLSDMNLDKFLSKGHMYQTEMRYYCRKRKSIEVPIHYSECKSGIKWKSMGEVLPILFRLRRNEALVIKKGTK